MSLPLLVGAAGIIFSGRVTSVSRSMRSSAEHLDKTGVTFEVENALRGATPGQRLMIYEWAELWSSRQRYRVGQHLLLFFYRPSKIGLTSPVADPMGCFTVDPFGEVIFNEQQIEAFRADPVLGGKSSVSYAVFARAVRRAKGQE